MDICLLIEQRTSMRVSSLIDSFETKKSSWESLVRKLCMIQSTSPAELTQVQNFDEQKMMERKVTIWAISPLIWFGSACSQLSSQLKSMTDTWAFSNLFETFSNARYNKAELGAGGTLVTNFSNNFPWRAIQAMNFTSKQSTYLSQHVHTYLCVSFDL